MSNLLIIILASLVVIPAIYVILTVRDPCNHRYTRISVSVINDTVVSSTICESCDETLYSHVPPATTMVADLKEQQDALEREEEVKKLKKLGMLLEKQPKYYVVQMRLI